MNEDDRIRLRHMLEAIDAAGSFHAGRRREDIESDQLLRFALVRAVEIVGEAASRISTPTRAGVPAIPWSAIIGMRNRVIHAYFDVDLDILWKTLTQDLPTLRKQLQAVLEGTG